MVKENSLTDKLLLLARLLFILVLSLTGLIFFAALGTEFYLWLIGEGFVFDWGGNFIRAIDTGIKIGGVLAILMWLGARFPKP